MNNTIFTPDSKINLNLELSTSNIPSVHELRLNNFKVRVMHHRYKYTPWTKCGKAPTNYNPISMELYPEKSLASDERSQKGGLTVLELTTPDKKHYSATAKCSLADNFNRKLGVRICIGRIMKQILNEAQNQVPF